MSMSRAIRPRCVSCLCRVGLCRGSMCLVASIGVEPDAGRAVPPTLREMGADLTYENERTGGGEPVADLRQVFRPI